MDLTSGARTTAAAAAALMLGGIGLTCHGLWRDQASHSLAGVVLSMIALTAIILAVLHRWITDTRLERQVLAAAQRQAQTERATYIAAKAALENEQTRLYRDLAADRAADTQRLAVERQAMQDEFDDARAQLVTEAMATVASWIIDGKVRPPERLAGNLIQFPRQEQQRERAHGHGAVVP